MSCKAMRMMKSNPRRWRRENLRAGSFLTMILMSQRKAMIEMRISAVKVAHGRAEPRGRGTQRMRRMKLQSISFSRIFRMPI